MKDCSRGPRQARSPHPPPLTPVSPSPQVPRYLLLVEPPRGGALPRDAAARVEAALCEENPVYRTWRGKGAIGPCEVEQARDLAAISTRPPRPSPYSVRLAHAPRAPTPSSLPAPSSRAGPSWQVRPGGFDALRRRRIEQEGASPQQLKVSRVVRRPDHLSMLRPEGK